MRDFIIKDNPASKQITCIILLKFSALIRLTIKEATTNPTIALGSQSSERIK